MRVINIDLDEDFLKRFYDLTGDKVPETITIVSLKKQVLSIKERFKTILANADGSSASNNTKKIVDENAEETNYAGMDVLLVDNLGVITYQIQMILSKLGLHVTNVKDVYNALSLYEDKEFSYILMDLQIPTEREGLILLKEIKRISKTKIITPIIGVMSVAGKKELKIEALEKGADFYLEKSNNWQEKLKDIMNNYVKNK